MDTSDEKAKVVRKISGLIVENLGEVEATEGVKNTGNIFYIYQEATSKMKTAQVTAKGGQFRWEEDEGGKLTTGIYWDTDVEAKTAYGQYLMSEAFALAVKKASEVSWNGNTAAVTLTT